MNIASLLQAQAASRPDAVAIIDTRRAGERRKTFAQLQDDAARKQMQMRADETVATMGGALPLTLQAIEPYLPAKAALQHAS